LIAGKLLATPCYPLDTESGPAWRGPLSGRPILTLQLPTIFIKAGITDEDDEERPRGKTSSGPVIFALRWWDNSMNAVKTPIWIAVSVYVLMAIAKKQTNTSLSLHAIHQILSGNVFRAKSSQQKQR